MAIVTGEPTSICIVWVALFAGDAFVPLSLQILLMYLLPCSSPPKATMPWLYDTLMSHVKIAAGSACLSGALHEAYAFSLVETTVSTCQLTFGILHHAGRAREYTQRVLMEASWLWTYPHWPFFWADET